MDYESDEQRKAVMATLRYKGLLYDSDYFDNSGWSQDLYISNSKELRIEFEEARKELEQKRKELDYINIEKKLELYEKKYRNWPKRLALIKEIKLLLSIEKPRKEEAIKSLSFHMNDVISKARKADIDYEIISLLRKKQQPLAKIIRERHL